MKRLLLVTLFMALPAEAKVDPKTVPGTVKWLCSNFESNSCKGKGKSDNSYHQCLEVLNSGLGQKRYAFSSAQAKACIAAQKSYLKKPDLAGRAAMHKTCGLVLSGLKKGGEACESPLDCATGLVCLGGKGALPGKCAKPLGEGESCDTDLLGGSAYVGLLQGSRSICGPGLFCSDTIGKPRTCVAYTLRIPSFGQAAGASCYDSGECKGVCENGKCKDACGAG